jgi:riboflavin kinase / FMN adenylyltransferase
MERFETWTDLPARARGASVALGAFDGLHLGHVAVLKAARTARPDVALAVAPFEPPPKVLFAGPGAPAIRLNTARLRAERAADVGADLVIELPFDAAMMAMDAVDFLDTVLWGGLAPAHVSVGHDFRFGAGRKGDEAALRAAGARHGFAVSVVEPVLDHTGTRYSSTRVREALTTGHLALATALLGRPWRVEGVVVHGEKRGRTIGFPTANFHLEGQLAPRFGVYAVRVRVRADDDGGEHGAWLSGVANFGRTPTTGVRDPLFEVHIFDLDADLYGRRLEVGLHAFLRGERTFATFPELVAQIGRDADDARTMLAVVR